MLLFCTHPSVWSCHILRSPGRYARGSRARPTPASRLWWWWRSEETIAGQPNWFYLAQYCGWGVHVYTGSHLSPARLTRPLTVHHCSTPHLCTMRRVNATPATLSHYKTVKFKAQSIDCSLCFFLNLQFIFLLFILFIYY